MVNFIRQEKEKKLAWEAGVEISQVHGPWTWPIREVTEEGRAERLFNMKKSIKYTKTSCYFSTDMLKLQVL